MQLKGTITIRPGYPEMPPLWSIELVKAPKTAVQAENELPVELQHLLDSSEQVELLMKDKLCLPSGQLVQPVLEQIKDELHLHYPEYCCEREMLDFLLSY